MLGINFIPSKYWAMVFPSIIVLFITLILFVINFENLAVIFLNSLDFRYFLVLYLMIY